MGAFVLDKIGRLATILQAGASRPLGGASFGWLLNAYAVVTVAVLILPILAVVPISLTSSTFLSFPPLGYSLRWFAEYLSSPVWISATIRSFVVGFITACLTLILTVPAVFGLTPNRSAFGGAVFLLFLTPMIVPSIVTAVALFYLFAQASLVATDTGLVIGHTVTSIPVALVILTATLKITTGRSTGLPRPSEPVAGRCCVGSRFRPSRAACSRPSSTPSRS